MGNAIGVNKVKDIGSITSISPGDNIQYNDINNNNNNNKSQHSDQQSKQTTRSKVVLAKSTTEISIPSSISSDYASQPTSKDIEKKIGKCEITSILGAEFAVNLTDMYDKNMMIGLESIKNCMDQWNDVYISYTGDSHELAKTMADFLSQKGMTVVIPSRDPAEGERNYKELLSKSRMVIGIIDNKYIESVYSEEETNSLRNEVTFIEEINMKRKLPCLGVVNGPYVMDHHSCGERLMNIFSMKSMKSTEDIFLDEMFFRVMKGVKKSLKTIKSQLSEINHDNPDSKFLPIYLNLPDTFLFDDKYVISSAFYKISNTSLVFYGIEKGSKNTNTSIVIKFMKNKADFEKEIKIREEIDKSLFMDILARYESHDYNVIFEQFGLGSFPHAVVMKKATKTLDSLIMNEMGGSRSQDWTRIKPVALQIVRTLSRLHDRGIVVGNLDPTNIMCDEDNIKFIDLKNCIHVNDVYKLCDNNTAYMPPELFVKNESGIAQTNNNNMKCSLSIDMWSLGCVLYELFTCETLFQCNSNLSLVDTNQVLDFSISILKNKLRKINNIEARDLLTLLLVKDPSGRTDIGHIFSNSFFTDNRALSNVLNHNEQFDVFLSYRNFSDYATAEIVHKYLISEGFSVYFDKLYNANMSWYENMSFGLKRSRVFLPLVSRAAIQNFEKLTHGSPADSLLIEYRIALEYKALSIIQDIVPVFIGDRDWSTGLCGNFFDQKCFPIFPDVVCKALEDAVGGDIQLPPGQAKSLKETCLSIFSLDSNNNPTDLTQLVIYQGDTDVFLNNLKLKLITKIAKLEEKECNDVAVDILSKLKDLQSLGYIIKDKHGNVLTYDAIIKEKM